MAARVLGAGGVLFTLYSRGIFLGHHHGQDRYNLNIVAIDRFFYYLLSEKLDFHDSQDLGKVESFATFCRPV